MKTRRIPQAMSVLVTALGVLQAISAQNRICVLQHRFLKAFFRGFPNDTE
jgi:hypothetical protein